MSDHDENAGSADPTGEADPDIELILDYLADKLDGADRVDFERRARHDRDFRYKLADAVLLKGLVVLALERDTEPDVRECRAAKRLFLDYLKGTTSSQNTAQLSRHIEKCLECEVALERLQQKPDLLGSPETVIGSKGAWGRLGKTARRLVAAALAVVVLTAGGFGLVAVLQGSAKRSGTPAAANAGGVLHPDAFARALDALASAEPRADQRARIADLARQVVDPSTTPAERAALYAAFGKESGEAAEPVLWVVAANEPVEDARGAAYRAIDFAKARDGAAMLAAARREIEARTAQSFWLIHGLLSRSQPEIRPLLTALFAAERDEDEEWRAEVLRQVYGTMKGEPVIEKRLYAYLADQNDRIRASAVVAAAEAGNASVVPLAIALLDSKDAKAQMAAVVVLHRHGSEEQFKTVLARDWSRDKNLKLAIQGAMQARGFALPQNP
jgi:hypothetical protein